MLCLQDIGVTGCLAFVPGLLTTDCVMLRLQDIEITGCTLFVNPYKEMEEEEKRKAEAARKKASALLWQSPFCLPSCCGVPLHRLAAEGEMHPEGFPADAQGNWLAQSGMQSK